MSTPSRIALSIHFGNARLIGRVAPDEPLPWLDQSIIFFDKILGIYSPTAARISFSTSTLIYIPCVFICSIMGFAASMSPYLLARKIIPKEPMSGTLWADAQRRPIRSSSTPILPGSQHCATTWDSPAPRFQAITDAGSATSFTRKATPQSKAACVDGSTDEPAPTSLRTASGIPKEGAKRCTISKRSICANKIMGEASNTQSSFTQHFFQSFGSTFLYKWYAPLACRSNKLSPTHTTHFRSLGLTNFPL